ncbi:hypothetical protein ACQKO5_19010 [Novosphingobium subterraneum]|jgi:hypothetical protein|uniref:hypothetical protein n=1 Tax=Novosphingobium subterraneum TaxID=48936 RepID=UPI003CFCAB0F
MTDVYRSNRRVTDSDLVRLNSVGLSLATIAETLGCHTSTVTQRLHALGVQPADTRRAFMEDIYLSMSQDQKTWLESQLGAHTPIKTYIKNLLMERYLAEQEKSLAA